MLPTCQVIPLPDYQASFQIDGRERLRWHFGPHYPRPFFFPLATASAHALTRMGHPGAPDHDHHRSIWFAHEKVTGVNFWTDQTTARVRQKRWLAYQDNENEAIMAVLLGWNDGHDPKDLLDQELIVAVRPGEHGDTLVELQSTFRPTAESLEFGKTNFGFLAVRVAKAISEFFGDGRLTNSERQFGEPAIFGKPAKWVDYSGEVARGRIEGITYHDHPSNPRYPNAWHVRADGWMSASPCFNGPLVTTSKKPLVLRYLLRAHLEPVNFSQAPTDHDIFGRLPRFEVVRSEKKNTHAEVRRAQN
jgi:hypothetical protein